MLASNPWFDNLLIAKESPVARRKFAKFWSLALWDPNARLNYSSSRFQQLHESNRSDPNFTIKSHLSRPTSDCYNLMAPSKPNSGTGRERDGLQQNTSNQESTGSNRNNKKRKNRKNKSAN